MEDGSKFRDEADAADVDALRSPIRLLGQPTFQLLQHERRSFAASGGEGSRLIFVARLCWTDQFVQNSVFAQTEVGCKKPRPT